MQRRILVWTLVSLGLCTHSAHAQDKEKASVDSRSIRALGNHRTDWDGNEPIYYWSDLGKAFEERELAWVFEQWSMGTPFRFVHEPNRRACEATRRCIKFVKQDKKARCASSIGRQFYVDPDVPEYSPEYRCAGAIVYVNPSLYCKGGKILGGWMHGAMLHEVGHSLGLFHEHQRFDRDEHIKVYPDRVRESGKFDILPIEKKYRIERKSKQKATMPMSTAWGPYNRRSVMHYWRKHKTNNGLVTLGGAPSLAALHMTKLQGSDIANVLSANFPKTAFLIESKDERYGARFAMNVGGPDLWNRVQAVPAGHRVETEEDACIELTIGKSGQEENADCLPARIVNVIGGIDVQSMVIPAGVVLTTHDSQHTLRFMPGQHETELYGNATYLFQPAATLFSVARYNRFLGSLDVGRYPIGELGQTPVSMTIGSGLSLRACFEDKGKSWCKRYASRPVQFLKHHDKLRSLELSLAVTVWDDVNFRSRRDNDPRGVESFEPRRDGRRVKYRPKSRRSLSRHRNRSMYVPPGLVARLCPAGAKQGCAWYSNQGIEKLPTQYFDQPIDVRVYPAATFFAGERFDRKARKTWSLHEQGERARIKASRPKSVILGPGVTLELCEDKRGARCCTFQGGEFGSRYSNLPEQCPLKPNFASLRKSG